MGGDGFLGWPTALYFSNQGHFVTIVDSFARRNDDIALGIESLTPIRTMNERLNVWKNKTEHKILFKRLDLSKNYRGLLGILIKLRPDVIIHCAEQRSAPYSMKSFYHRRATIDNNVNATHNLLSAIVESGRDTHLIHVGAVGLINGAGSVFDLSKIFDCQMINFYNYNDQVRISQVRLGIIWGSSTIETEMDEKLVNRFDYDGEYGTVINRFIAQGVCGHPLTVYGDGTQKRTFIHIQDSIEFIKHMIDYPPKCGEPVDFMDGTVEELSIIQIAELVSSITGAQIKFYQNPRNESIKEEVEEKLLLGGLKHSEGRRITEKDIEEICKLVYRYKTRCDFSKMLTTTVWNKDKKIDLEGTS